MSNMYQSVLYLHFRETGGSLERALLNLPDPVPGQVELPEVREPIEEPSCLNLLDVIVREDERHGGLRDVGGDFLQACAGAVHGQVRALAVKGAVQHVLALLPGCGTCSKDKACRQLLTAKKYTSCTSFFAHKPCFGIKYVLRYYM